MKKNMMACAFLMGVLFCLGPYVAAASERNSAAESRWSDDSHRDRRSDDSYRGRDRRGDNDSKYHCGIFAKSPRSSQREYSSCEDCVQENKRCEERCGESGYVCTAVGSRRRSFPQTVQGDPADNQRRAERKALRKCTDAGLHGCTLGQCSETMVFDPTKVTPCPSYERHSERRDRNNHSDRRGRDDNRYNNTAPPLPPPPALPNMDGRNGHRNFPPPPVPNDVNDRNKHRNSPPPTVHQPIQPTQKYVTSWQHLKGQCQGTSYPKVARQCGGRGVWHGIFCRVTWSDGSTEDLHGKVDQTDPYGRAYCTRSTRPAHFNCVSRCDDTNGPLTTLPRP